MLNVIPIFAILCFHVFDKMTIIRIKNKKLKKKTKKKNKERHVQVEEQIGRTNVEEYYYHYVSKLHS